MIPCGWPVTKSNSTFNVEIFAEILNFHIRSREKERELEFKIQKYFSANIKGKYYNKKNIARSWEDTARVANIILMQGNKINEKRRIFLTNIRQDR